MGSLLETVEQFLTQDEWPYTRLEEKTILRTAFRGRNASWTCYAQTNEDKFLFLFYSVSPVNVPEEKRPLLAEFITRANYGMLVGNFELDYNDGEIRFKTSVDIEAADFSTALVNNLVYANVSSMDRYIPGIMSVIYGNVPAQEAIQKIEG